MGAAAEAVVSLPRGRDGKGGRLLVVEGTAGRKQATPALQWHMGIDDIDDVYAGE